ncbi:MAG: YraN family protein [Thermoanaerobaculia bacterium]
MKIRIADLGPLGERRAVWFYRLRGFRVVERNVRIGDAEVDLVVKRGGLLVFVEVKTRQQDLRGAPWEAVDREKQLRIMRLAERYVAAHTLRPKTIRFDVISLFWTGWRFRVECFTDAFRAEYDPVRPWRMV